MDPRRNQPSRKKIIEILRANGVSRAKFKELSDSKRFLERTYQKFSKAEMFRFSTLRMLHRNVS